MFLKKSLVTPIGHFPLISHFSQCVQQARRVALLCFAGVALSACNNSVPVPNDRDLHRAENLRPKDLALTERYERSCMTCHAKPGSGAPLTGFKAAWKAPLDKGMPLLIQHTKQGFNGMPPLGMCSDCTDEQLTQLIEFMSGQEKS